MVFETWSFRNKLLEIVRPNNFALDTTGIQTSSIEIGSKMPVCISETRSRGCFEIRSQGLGTPSPRLSACRVEFSQTTERLTKAQSIVIAQCWKTNHGTQRCCQC